MVEYEGRRPKYGTWSRAGRGTSRESIASETVGEDQKTGLTDTTKKRTSYKSVFYTN